MDFQSFLLLFQAGTQGTHGIRIEHLPDSAEGTQCVHPWMARQGDKGGMQRAAADLLGAHRDVLRDAAKGAWIPNVFEGMSLILRLQEMRTGAETLTLSPAAGVLCNSRASSRSLSSPPKLARLARLRAHAGVWPFTCP